MNAWRYAIPAAGTALWCFPFLLARGRLQVSLTRDRRARWGVALEGLGYTLLWQGSFWLRSPARWQIALAAVLFAIACALSWTAAQSLGRHLRVDAALEDEHRLIRTGPYRFMRHPIYTSMLAVLLGTGIPIAPWSLLVPALALFLLGTAIRVRVEEALLESRFGDEFRRYRQSVAALIPFVA
ncbi:MAG TPA: isoprenylcysteine carboxylmethyltransferase family protein [Bryobacteraceae bacterium]|jgi:protein-S-isoprenylcysteine O-methyltransferase Ste14|nr:isoprenylcysteine carboxylmethyltransferase family protein [Bryobacteraceae bacterium]